MFIEVHSHAELHQHLSTGSLNHVVIQGLDLHEMHDALCAVSAAGAVFLGCLLDEQTTRHILNTGGLLFPSLQGLPYQPFRPHLYTAAELMDGYRIGEHSSFQTDTLDSRIYTHFQSHRTAEGPDSIMETLAQRLHDHSIDDALNDLLHQGSREVVGVMGGHAMKRTDPEFRAVAHVAHALSKAGLFVATGGGPGAMEAANLGAWMGPYTGEQLDDVVNMLASAPKYTDEGWFDTAMAALKRYPNGAESLAIPTWFYGHEPSNLFATHIAKYFANAIREDGLLAIATRGIIFAPGSAGTIQEIFMDAAQNHYGTFQVVSPMIFFGEQYWTEQRPIYPLLQQLAAGRQYAEMLSISDDPSTIAAFVLANPPVPYSG